eukprot:TRINITY_DN6717_c0_g1_i1.p1 TRINITY_DN6717_c0_g1~~TRINITY_DN6717_c0_g1_i1.p1  ORF type:complete len:151 (-),score=2.41 TRINITY_DN6717_c0_g1_i1:408-860(-)
MGRMLVQYFKCCNEKWLLIQQQSPSEEKTGAVGKQLRWRLKETSSTKKQRKSKERGVNKSELLKFIFFFSFLFLFVSFLFFLSFSILVASRAYLGVGPLTGMGIFIFFFPPSFFLLTKDVKLFFFFNESASSLTTTANINLLVAKQAKWC